jgi:hypothetical protein
MRRFIAVLAAGLFACAAPAADEAVTIKIKKSGPGEVNDTTKSEKVTNKITISAGGKDQVREENVSSKMAYQDEVIERPADAKRATKLKRTYKTAELVKDNTAVELGLADKTVMIEKKGDKYEFTIDGKAVSGPAAELLTREFGKEKHLTEDEMFPKGPVKVGESWKIDGAKVAKELGETGMVIDADKTTATGKLLRAYDKGGSKYGVLEITMEVAVTALKGGAQEITVKPGSKLTITLNADACIDGTQDAGKAKTTMKGDLQGSVAGAELKFDLNVTQDNVSEEVKKK